MDEWTKDEIESHERWQASRLDGHYCFDWDEMAINAWMPEYDCCDCSVKSWLGRLVNWFVMWRWNRAAREARNFYPWKKEFWA